MEAGWRLGDRLLVLTAPQLRGDDVAQLQTALSHLGFDCGRPDGIFGPATVRALQDFQKNCGLSVDGICGPRTGRMLEVLARQSGTGPGVASLRENEAMLAGRGALPALRVVVGQFGGLSSIARAVARSLRQGGASVMSTDEYEAPAQAAAANRFGASVYIGFEAVVDAASTVSYFAVPTFESVGGRSLAERVLRHVAPALTGSVTLQGMRLPVLRETRMPAILCSLGPVRQVVDATDALAAAVTGAVAEWASHPLSVPSTR